jgi:hypothetical protein
MWSKHVSYECSYFDVNYRFLSSKNYTHDISNSVMLNITKTNVIKFKPKTTIHVPMDISYKNHILEEVTSTKSLGIHIDSHMNWKNHIEQISHKLNVACFMIRNLTHTLNTDILHMVYFAYFQPVFQYRIIFFFLGGGGFRHMHNKYLNYKKE